MKSIPVAFASVIVTSWIDGLNDQHGFDAVSVYVPAGSPVNRYQPGLISSSKLEPLC
ncbi:MAG TPA: hypothetical protein PKJ37_10150 [Acidobacteriota bacterium]|nr:hypothetical protein [Acidobacteriota bacterium]